MHNLRLHLPSYGHDGAVTWDRALGLWINMTSRWFILHSKIIILAFIYQLVIKFPPHLMFWTWGGGGGGGSGRGET